MAAARRASCVLAINRFVQSHGSTELVVCSRLEDYEALGRAGARLQLQAALSIQPLTAQKIDRYLASAGEELAAVRQTLHTDTALGELARSPLMLNIITLAYRGMTAAELPMLSLEERRSGVRQRDPTKASGSPPSTASFLAFLAFWPWGWRRCCWITPCAPGGCLACCLAGVWAAVKPASSICCCG